MNGSPLRLLHLTDPHLHAQRDARMRGVSTDETLLATLEHARTRSPAPDAVLATGDLVQDESAAGYARFRELLQSAGCPVYCLPGNHDAPGPMQAALSAAPFQFCGEAVHGPWTLIMLDTFAAGDDGGVLAAGELARLERGLERSRGGHCLVALHHQPLAMGSRWLDSVGLRNADEFFRICDAQDHLRAIVWGHVHQASDRVRNGVRLLSTPSTCSQFAPGSAKFALDTRPPGYRWIELAGDGSIHSSVIWVE